MNNYCDFEICSSENFARYDNQYGVIFTWIFMWDKSEGKPLQAVTDLLPGRVSESGLKKDGGMSGGKSANGK